MARSRRSFTPEERLSLLQDAEREGYMETVASMRNIFLIDKKRYYLGSFSGSKAESCRGDDRSVVIVK